MAIEFFYVYARVFALLALLILICALWVAAELYWSAGVRIGMGATAISMCCALAFLIGVALQHANSSLWFGEMSRELVDASVDELERGRSEAVLNALRQLRDGYRSSPPKDRANYFAMTKNAIADMKTPREADEPSESGPGDE